MKKEHGGEVKCWLTTHRARGVQNLKHALLAVHLHLLPVAVLYGGVVLLHEDALDKLDSQGGLAHAAASQHHDLVFPHDLNISEM